MNLFKILLSASFLLCLLSSCDDFLEEKPLDFLAPENSLNTIQDFNNSINYLYNKNRYIICEMDADTRNSLYYATDFATYGPHVGQKLNDFSNTMVPTFSVPLNLWKENYQIINNANLILNRIISNQQISEDDKKTIVGEASFFRAYAYRMLAHLFGGVPKVLEPILTPRRDFVRASREEIYTQIKEDLKIAIQNLPNIDEAKSGKVNKQVAQHLLAETNICLGLYNEAISAASQVIDYPKVGLMTERFGSRMSEEGDVYWDLFRLNNQNRESGNKEGLWVIQYDYLNSGSEKNYNMVSFIVPYYVGADVTYTNNQGEEVTTKAFTGPTDMKGGRGIGWLMPTKYFFEEIWENSPNDIRNSSHNIIRDFKIDNPECEAFGQWYVKDGYSKHAESLGYWYPIITKFSRIGNFPEEFYQRDKNGNPLLTAFGEHLLLNSANSTFKDEYYFRLAETYLIRAEAYLLKGDKTQAANDINTLRKRAQTTEITSDKVDMDFILDERMRELYGEETRMLTLCRMGKLVERNKKYNPFSGTTIKDYNNLWPIPFSEIERNTEALLEQNPGY